LLHPQRGVHLLSGVPAREENIPLTIRGHQPVRPNMRALSEQHDVAFSQFFDRDGTRVENLSIPNCGLHAAAVGLEPDLVTARQQSPA